MNVSFKIMADLAELNVLPTHLRSVQNEWLLPGRIIAQINLILDEHITNIIEHGKLDKSHAIDVALAKSDTELIITVIDDGPPFDPTLCAAPDVTLPLEKRQCGGLGIHLVRSLCDCCSYTRSAGKNILTLKRTLSKECR